MDFAKLLAYQKGFRLAMEIFQISKSFPKEEKYALTDQIRRSSRSVCACLAEFYRKRNYPAHFISKLSDSDMENSETQVWLDFALACEYLDNSAHERLVLEVQEVGKLINFMMLHPENSDQKKSRIYFPPNPVSKFPHPSFIRFYCVLRLQLIAENCVSLLRLKTETCH